MAFENLINVSSTEAELRTLDTAINNIETVLKGGIVRLTPDQRQQYDSMAERNKLFVNNAKNIRKKGYKVLLP